MIGQNVMVVHAGGLGDLVLLSELIASLKKTRSEAILTLICRAEFESIVDCYPVPPDEVVGLPFQPYASKEPSNDTRASLQPVLSQFAGRRVTVLVDAALRTNWLSEFLATALEPENAIRCGAGAHLQDSGPHTRSFRNLERPRDIHERDRYRLLADALGSTFTRVFPWTLSEKYKESALDWLRRHGLEPGKYLVCAPFGAASTTVKRWPLESFNDLLHRFFGDSRWPALLMGDHTEDQLLVGLERLLFDMPTSRFAGRPNELLLAAGLLSMSGAYLSNDSGLMHLAQAFESPGAAIFGGGGEWPAYAPWARGSAGLCQPLPCFGCEWDCFLGHGLCVESIPVEKVHETLSAVCRAPLAPPRNVILETFGEPLLGLVSDASARYRDSERDRSKRLDVIVDLNSSRHLLATREEELLTRLAAMEQVAAERLTLLENVHTEAARRLDLIDEISAHAEIRRQSIEQLTAALARSEAARLEMERSLGPEDPRPIEGRHWIVTGADEEYFANARLLIASWWRHMPSTPLLFCDFGLTAEQREEAAAWPVQLVATPVELAGTSPRRAKAGLARYLDAAATQWKSVTWIDADAMLLRPLPRLDEILCGYDLLCDAPVIPVSEAMDPAALAILPVDPADAYFGAGFWTATSSRLLQAFDRFAGTLLPGGRFREGAALTAAIYATRARVRTLAPNVWCVHGDIGLDGATVDGDSLEFAGQHAYVLHADRRFVIREDGQRVLNRDVLRANQTRLEECYRAALEDWRQRASVR